MGRKGKNIQVIRTRVLFSLRANKTLPAARVVQIMKMRDDYPEDRQETWETRTQVKGASSLAYTLFSPSPANCAELEPSMYYTRDDDGWMLLTATDLQQKYKSLKRLDSWSSCASYLTLGLCWLCTLRSCHQSEGTAKKKKKMLLSY